MIAWSIIIISIFFLALAAENNLKKYWFLATVKVGVL